MSNAISVLLDTTALLGVAKLEEFFTYPPANMPEIEGLSPLQGYLKLPEIQKAPLVSEWPIANRPPPPDFLEHLNALAAHPNFVQAAVDLVIESLVLYDLVLFEGFSFERYQGILPLSKFVFEGFSGPFSPSDDADKLLRIDHILEDHWVMNSELLVPRYPKKYVLAEKSDYYEQLQQILGTHLALHPARRPFYAGSDNRDTPQDMIKQIQARVEPGHAERIGEWMENKPLYAQIPLLSRFVLNQIDSWANLPTAIQQVRDSSEAIAFRDGFRELVEAVATMDRVKSQKIADRLNSETELWKTSIDGTRTKPISISKGGAKADFEIPKPNFLKAPFKWLPQEAPEKLLTFVHGLLTTPMKR